MEAVHIRRRLRDPTQLLWGAVPVLAASLGIAVGVGHPEVVALAMLPLLAVAVAGLGGSGRWIVILVALSVGFVGSPLSDRLPVGGANVFLPDVLVAGAVGGLLLEWLISAPDQRPRLPRTALLGVPLFCLLIALSAGAMKGHDRYDATLLGMPLRLVGYAAIVAALPGLTPGRALRGLTVVAYGGAAWLAGVAAFHIATGTSATTHDDLSTGGIRYIGVAAATYAAAAFLLAILNLSARRGKPLLHLGVALLAGFDVIVTYTRTVWLVLFVLLVVCAIASPAIRRALAASVPVVTPLLVLGVLVILSVAPSLVSTLVDRVSTPAGQDTSVQWRTQAYQAVLSGTSDEPLLGIGFGRTTSFSINGMPNVITGDPHNGFLYVFAGAGVVGVAALSLVLLSFLGSVAFRWRRAEGEARTLLAWCLCTWVLILTHAASEPVFTTPSFIILLWITMLLPAIVGGGPAVATAPSHRGAAVRRPRSASALAALRPERFTSHPI